jgi:hypothetical protein
MSAAELSSVAKQGGEALLPGGSFTGTARAVGLRARAAAS